MLAVRTEQGYKKGRRLESNICPESGLNRPPYWHGFESPQPQGQFSKGSRRVLVMSWIGIGP
jgi:hypothetical protein